MIPEAYGTIDVVIKAIWFGAALLIVYELTKRYVWPRIPTLPKQLRARIRFKRIDKDCQWCAGLGHRPFPGGPGAPEIIYPCSNCHGAKQVFSHVQYRHPWLAPKSPEKDAQLTEEAEEVLSD